MNLRHITAALLALLALGAGAAAATPGAAPDGAPANDQSDAGPSVDIGPPGDLPSQVPDFVSSIHDRIGGFLDGSIDSLGEAISGVTPDGEEQPAGSGDESGSSDA